MSVCSINVKPEQLKRFAELLRVDEVQMYDTNRGAYGFRLRIGVYWDAVEVEEVSLLRTDRRADLIVRVLFDKAREMKVFVEREAHMLTTGFKQLEPEWLPIRGSVDGKNFNDYINYITNATALSMAVPKEQLSPAVKTKELSPMDRFAAIMLEMEDT